MLKPKCRKCFEVISVPTRFKIFNFLKINVEGVTIKTIVKLTKLRQPTVTFHISEMEKNGLVKKTRSGKEVFCFLKQSCELCPLFS
jgi:DNA-binding transcriptional ArsR family regulator